MMPMCYGFRFRLEIIANARLLSDNVVSGRNTDRNTSIATGPVYLPQPPSHISERGRAALSHSIDLCTDTFVV